MYFALFYILFFTLDILLIMKFLLLGMIPMHYLVAGVGLFCCAFLLKRFSFFSIITKHSFIPILFFCYILIFSLFRLFQGSRRMFAYSNILAELNFLPDWIFSIFAAILSLLIGFMIHSKSSLSNWMFFSAVASVIGNGFPLVFGMPVLYYRYSGVFDMLMLFGWLMIIITLMRMEYGLEDAGHRNSSTY